MKSLIKLIFLSIFILSCGDNSSSTDEQDSASSCNASINMKIVLNSTGIGFNIEATNTGDFTINSITVPFILFFTDNSTVSGRAYATAFILPPGESTILGALVDPASQNPYNPRYIYYEGRSFDKVEYSTPVISCN